MSPLYISAVEEYYGDIECASTHADRTVRSRRSVGVVGVFAALVACSDSSGTYPTGTYFTSPGLDVVQAHGLFVLTRKLVPSGTMDALFEGTVVVDDTGCIRLSGADDATVIWPYGFTAALTIEGVEVHDGSGNPVGRLGDQFYLSGGDVETLHAGLGFTDEDRDLASQHCPGRYWIVS